MFFGSRDEMWAWIVMYLTMNVLKKIESVNVMVYMLYLNKNIFKTKKNLLGLMRKSTYTRWPTGHGSSGLGVHLGCISWRVAGCIISRFKHWNLNLKTKLLYLHWPWSRGKSWWCLPRCFLMLGLSHCEDPTAKEKYT